MYFQLLQAIKTPFFGIKPITTGFQPARFMSQYQSFGQKIGGTRFTTITTP